MILFYNLSLSSETIFLVPVSIPTGLIPIRMETAFSNEVCYEIEVPETNTSTTINNSYNLRGAMNPFNSLVLSPAVTIGYFEDHHSSGWVTQKGTVAQNKMTTKKNKKKKGLKKIKKAKKNTNSLLEPVTTSTVFETITKNEVYDEKEELPEFCLTRRGNAMMILSDYRYTRQYLYNNRQRERWVCTSQGSKKCKATIWTLNNVIMEAYTEHTHPPYKPERNVTSEKINYNLNN